MDSLIKYSKRIIEKLIRRDRKSAKVVLNSMTDAITRNMGRSNKYHP